MSEYSYLENGLESSLYGRGQKITVYIHESRDGHVGRYVIRDLENHNFNVVTNETGCLCAHKKEELNFEGQGIILLDTLNGVTENLEESINCNGAVGKIIKRNPKIRFWAMDFGDGKFREEFLGIYENLTYIRYVGYTLNDFLEEARSLRR